LSLRKGNWKLLKESNEAEWSLFDMDKDPTEMNNLAKSYPEITKSLIEEYKTWSVNVGVKEFKGKVMQNGK
ncbi:MAG: hypothetical protein ACK43L_08780, partial [Sphingobacteriales bacterium]